MKLIPMGRSVGKMAKEATAPPPSVGRMSAAESRLMMYEPLPYEMVASGSLIVMLNSTTLVAPLLLTRSSKVDAVRLTVGVPYIVPLLAPRLSPAGSVGTKAQETMLPLIPVGTIGAIWVPRSSTKAVWA